MKIKTFSNSNGNLLFPTYFCDYMYECAKNGDNPNLVYQGLLASSYDLKEDFGKRIRDRLKVQNVELYMKQSLKHEKEGTLLEWRTGVSRNFL